VQKGDLIVALDGGGAPAGLRHLLFSHKPGISIAVVVRGEQTLELSATLEGQAGDR
jgi:hypothetical protein